MLGLLLAALAPALPVALGHGGHGRPESAATLPPAVPIQAPALPQTPPAAAGVEPSGRRPAHAEGPPAQSAAGPARPHGPAAHPEPRAGSRHVLTPPTAPAPVPTAAGDRNVPAPVAAPAAPAVAPAPAAPAPVVAPAASTVPPAPASAAPVAPTPTPAAAPRTATPGHALVVASVRSRPRATPGTVARPVARPHRAAVVAPARWTPAASTGTPVATPRRTLAAAKAPAVHRARHPAVLRAVPVVLAALAGSVAFVPEGVWIALGLLGVFALAMLAVALVRHRQARRLTRERAGLLAELDALEDALVPTLPRTLGGLALSVVSMPATRLGDGGDFHDAFALSGDRVAVLLGDVAGTGRQARADAQLVRHSVRAYLEAGLEPRAALSMTGAVIDDRGEPLFASVVVAVHDRRHGTLTFAGAGHEPPILVSEDGARLPPVSGWSPPLGTGLETGRRQTTLPLPEGSAACLVTDGVPGAFRAGRRLGLAPVVDWLSALGPRAAAADVLARLRRDADAAGDDVTVCLLRALTPARSGGPRVEEALVEGGDPTYLVRFLRECGLPEADAQEAGDALAATPDGTRMIATVEICGPRAVVELAPLGNGTQAQLVR